MTMLVVGASGATGRLLVDQLLNRGQNVKIVVRTPESLPDILHDRENLAVVYASILDVRETKLIELTRGCEAVASCLGHNMSFKGLFGQPRQLVTDATRRLCRAIKANSPGIPVKFVLMNTTGNSNRDIPEKVSLGQRCVIGLLRVLLPPHRDNENAADYLRTEFGQSDKMIGWSVVRPDGLVDENTVSEYNVYPSPTRSAIFNSGQTSRINVAHFMADLITDAGVWQTWKGQMPVIYNKSSA